MTLGLLIKNFILSVLSPVGYLLIALAVVFFLVGIVRFMFSAGDVEKRKEGRTMMIYGIIGLFVMVSVWGLVSLLSNTFDLDNRPSDDLPSFGNNTGPNLNDRSRYNYGVLPSERDNINQEQNNDS